MLKEKSNTVRTTIYLTENNKQWLTEQPRGHRTKMINIAIEKFKDKQIMAEKKERVLNTLNNLPLYKTRGISIKEVINDQRDRNIK